MTVEERLTELERVAGQVAASHDIVTRRNDIIMSLIDDEVGAPVIARAAHISAAAVYGIRNRIRGASIPR